jgi:hypothetical protein
MKIKELVYIGEQSNMVTTIANVLQKGKETGQTVQSTQKPQQTAQKANQSGVSQQPMGTSGTQGTSTVSKPQQNTTNIQKPINIPTGTRIDPVVSKDPNVLKFKMDNAVFSLDTKDPQNSQMLQQLQSMGIKKQS